MREARQHDRKENRKDGTKSTSGPQSGAHAHGGLIFDVSDMGQMNVGDLSLLLTASRLARKKNLEVWITGLPGRSWAMLHALGLGGEFKQFPDETDDYSA